MLAWRNLWRGSMKLLALSPALIRWTFMLLRITRVAKRTSVKRVRSRSVHAVLFVIGALNGRWSMRSGEFGEGPQRAHDASYERCWVCGLSC